MRCFLISAETDQSDLEGNHGETSSIEFYGQVNRMQREMLCLLQRFVLSEKVLKELHNLDNKLGVEGDDLKAEIILTYKKIITNVVAYCRLLITKSGKAFISIFKFIWNMFSLILMMYTAVKYLEISEIFTFLLIVITCETLLCM